jgi:hypothetical protein
VDTASLNDLEHCVIFVDACDDIGDEAPNSSVTFYSEDQSQEELSRPILAPPCRVTLSTQTRATLRSQPGRYRCSSSHKRGIVLRESILNQRQGTMARQRHNAERFKGSNAAIDMPG